MQTPPINPATFLVRVWDLPTRLFHWLLAACVVGSVASAWIGGNAMTWHFRLGYVTCALLLFRLAWGVIGGRWSRFASFFYAPGAVLRYLRGRSGEEELHDVGHSPLGALSVFAMLAVLCAQVGTGLFADDEVANTGPLQPLVADATSLALTHWHRRYGQWLVIGLVALHVAAVAYYALVKRRVLLRPMLTGDKVFGTRVPVTLDTARTRWIAFGVVLASAALVVAMVRYCS